MRKPWTLVATIVLVCIATAQLARGESLVDWLNARGFDSSFAARTTLWITYSPKEKYSGTADQNTTLLAALKLDESAPSLTISTALVATGGEVTAVVSAGAGGAAEIGVESELRAQSFPATSGQNTSLGNCTGGGFYVIRLIDGPIVREGMLFLTPEGDKFKAEFVSGTRKVAAGTSAAAEPTPEGFKPALDKIERTWSSDRLKAAAQASTEPYLAENIASLGTTLVVCSVGAASGGVGLLKCFESVGANVMDYGATVFEQYLTLQSSDANLPVADRLTADEVSLIVTVIKVANTTAQVGLSAKGDGDKICKLMEGLGTIVNQAAAEIDNQGVRMTVMATIQETQKVVVLVCAHKEP
jgi:hypothetical protein